MTTFIAEQIPHTTKETKDFFNRVVADANQLLVDLYREEQEVADPLELARIRKSKSVLATFISRYKQGA